MKDINRTPEKPERKLIRVWKSVIKKKYRPVAAAVSSRSGALTVEAALVLPVLLCAFFSVIFLIKAVYAYQLIGHALNETASEIASTAYIYHVSGFRDMHDTVRNGISEKSEVFRNQIDTVFSAYNSLMRISEKADQGGAGLTDDIELFKDATDSFEGILDEAQVAISDPLKFLKCVACYIAKGSFNDAKTELFTPITRLYMKKYLATERMPDADQRLKSLNIRDGFDGLDFSESAFLSDRGEYIDIVVRYSIDLPLPVKFISGLELVQRAKVKAWMGGDEAQGVLTGVTDDIWSLGNFQRGLKIRRLFGANLPTSFPVIARFDQGRAVMIKSMDLTADSYQQGNNAEKTLQEYVDKLSQFKGQETPWGSDGIVIRSEDIISRELVLVIPKNELSEANEQLLQNIVQSAASKGVTLTVERYGTKIIETEHKGTEQKENPPSAKRAGEGLDVPNDNAKMNDDQSICNGLIT